MQYTIKVGPDYVPHELPRIWDDFAQGEKGIIFTIWNASWLWWLADCEKLPDCPLRDFLRTKPFEGWAYVPVDGHCTGEKLPSSMGEILYHFERVLAYTGYGSRVIGKTLDKYRSTGEVLPEVPHLPHGLDTSVFFPRDRAEGRRTFVQRVLGLDPAELSPQTFLVGVVATNSARKDWYLAFETCAELLKRGVAVGLWAHTDVFKKNWDLPALAEEFGMKHRVMWSNRMLSDDELVWGYSTCDVTLGIGSGEGWGFSLAESLACGVPVVHGKYAGGADFVPESMLVEPIAFRGDGMYGIRRPVFDAVDWAAMALYQTNVPMDGRGWEDVTLPPQIDWTNAWKGWSEWLIAGVK